LLYRSGLDGSEVDEVVFGQVVPSVQAPNVAREVSLLPQFPKTIPAHTLNRACASSGQAVAVAHDQIVLGQADVVIAGGAEKMAKENGITREAQDRYALMSHQRAAAAAADGRLTAEIAPWFGGRSMDEVTTADNGIRTDTSLETLAQLPPAFDRKYGSVTAGNASPLTDGAAAVVVMAREKAEALGMRPLAAIRSYAVAAVDPGWQLLMGPAFAVPRALDRAGISFKELGVVEIHEAFAAQVLSNVEAWASNSWAEKHGRSAPVGEVDWERTNVLGGSIAIGHPFGATGARLVTTLANEMTRRDVEFGLLSICAQGGMGFAMVLERA
jgi:acetyl-CoA acyltransferase